MNGQLWSTPTDQLKAKVLAEAQANDDFRRDAAEHVLHGRDRSECANANPTNANIGNAITAGLRAEKADG